MKMRRISLVVPMALAISLMLLIPQVSSAVSFGGFVEDDFKQISEGGFGDPMNNYAFSMTYFCGDLYVGTARNAPYIVLLSLEMEGAIPSALEIAELLGITYPGGVPYDPGTGLPTGDPEWAQDMTPEIWRYHCGTWELVYRPDPYGYPGPYQLPLSGGFRTMTTFDGAIYAGVSVGFGPILLVKSTSGDYGTWIPVDRTGIPLDRTDTRAIIPHCGKLYVAANPPANRPGPAEIYASPEPGVVPWTQVTDFASEDPDNLSVMAMASFNGRLYASTQNDVSGFQVWRSKCEHPESGDDWEKIVTDGAGDARNPWGGTMGTYDDHLYVGSMSWPVPTSTRSLKGFDLIRIDAEDNWELIVGSYIPIAPTVPRGPPLSGWPAGFANPGNLYCWSLEVHCGLLYLGTFDASAFLRFITPEMIESLLNQETQDLEMLDSIAEELRNSDLDETYVQELLEILEEEVDLATLIQMLWQFFGGGDLWKSCDGVHWKPVSLNGFDNPNNYGFRNLVSTPDGLYVGTGNPWTGCEIWLGTKGTIVSTNMDGDEKFQFSPNEDVYVKGEGFPPCRDVTIYVIPDGLDTTPGNAVADSTGVTDIGGDLPVTLVWSGPLVMGEYDIWVDVNQNGEHDDCDIYVAKALECYMFFVIPEFPMGTIASVLATVCGLGVFALKKKRKGIQRFQ